MPHGTRAEGFGDAATTKRRGSDLDESRDSFHEKESGDENSRPESNPDSTENAHTDALFSKNTHVVTTVIDDDLTTVGDTTELARASAATELAARDSCAAGKMSYAALAALSLASASAAVVLTLETLMRDSDDLNSSQNSGKQKPTDQPLALVGHERTLRLAKRVIREAQEHGKGLSHVPHTASAIAHTRHAKGRLPSDCSDRLRRLLSIHRPIHAIHGTDVSFFTIRLAAVAFSGRRAQRGEDAVSISQSPRSED
jgi:hypothetical protein